MQCTRRRRVTPRYVNRPASRASWLNMIEIWFSILSRRLLRRRQCLSACVASLKTIKAVTRKPQPAALAVPAGPQGG